MEERFTFKKNEKLCHKRQIDYLFENGRWIRSNSIRVIYRESEDNLPVNVQVLFSAPKKIHRRAVTRNLLKRRMREAYRLNSKELKNVLTEKDKNLLLAFVYGHEEIFSYAVIQSEMKNLLAQIERRVKQ